MTVLTQYGQQSVDLSTYNLHTTGQRCFNLWKSELTVVADIDGFELEKGNQTISLLLTEGFETKRKSKIHAAAWVRSANHIEVGYFIEQANGKNTFIAVNFYAPYKSGEAEDWWSANHFVKELLDDVKEGSIDDVESVWLGI